MGVLDFFKRGTTPPKTDNRSIEGFRSINTEGKDLSQPFVDDYYNRGYSWVMFGEDNLYPQILDQLYISAPMHQACCNFKKFSLIGNGYEWKGFEDAPMAEKIQIKQFETQSNFDEAHIQIAMNWIKHGRSIVVLHYSKEHGKYTHFKVVDPADIRNNHLKIFESRPTKYFYSKDWSRSYAEYNMTPYYSGNTDTFQVLEIRNNIGGFKSYGMPDWISSANWQKVGADIALLHKSAIENGIQPSMIFRYPYIMSDEERSDWEAGMRKNAKGAKNYGRAMKVEALGKDQMPEFDVANTTDNHALFEQTSREYKEEVAISHNINPALMGVRIAGALGQKEEIEFSAKQFEKIWLNENRDIIEKFLNKIASICGVTTKLHINKTEILDIIGVTDSTSETVTEKETEQLSVNENLRGLSAKDNMDIIRITRDFTKGKLSKPLARTRLAAYGIDAQTINEILEQ